MTVIQPDTNITDAVDTLRYTIKDTEILLQNRDCENLSGDLSLSRNGNNSKKRNSSLVAGSPRSLQIV